MATRSAQTSVVLPEEFIRYYAPYVDDVDAFVSSVQTPLPKTFRMNRLKSDPAEIQDRFAKYGITIQQAKWCEDAFTALDADPSPVLEHFLGKIYMQELTSMLPPLIAQIEIAGANWVLDACAAPGSKSTQIAAMLNHRGVLVANDVDYNRVRGLKHNLAKAGAINVIITQKDLRKFPMEPRFDVIFLDAPCSSDGTLRKSPTLAEVWSPERARKYDGLQKHLSRVAYELLRPGGTLLYSTCSHSALENEAVVDYLLRNADPVVETIKVPGFAISEGLTEFHGSQFDDRVKMCARIWGHHNDTGGFFVAKLRKPD